MGQVRRSFGEVFGKLLGGFGGIWAGFGEMLGGHFGRFFVGFCKFCGGFWRRKNESTKTNKIEANKHILFLKRSCVCVLLPPKG